MAQEKVIRVIELFSGIGGFHLALKSCQSLKDYQLRVYPFDNNCHANKVYEHNFGIKPNHKNIEHLTANDFDPINPQMITLSPPCQPYSRAGKQNGHNDQRSNALHHFCLQILPKLKNLPSYIMLENVIGFEVSQSCKLFLESLIARDYVYKIYQINPTQIGMPNTRKRIYILAHLKKQIGDDANNEILSELPIKNAIKGKQTIGDVLAMNETEEKFEKYVVPMDKISKCKGYKFDIATVLDCDSECFTKAYGTKKNFSKGTGSLFASKLIKKAEINEFKTKYEQLFENGEHDKIVELLRDVGLRYFSPKEMSLLMGFPSDFSFVDDMNDAQFYKLIGNSVNVRVVSALLDLLVANQV